MLRHYYGSLAVGGSLVVLAGCGVPDQIAELHRQALAAERAAVQALNQVSDDASDDQLSQLREQYEKALGEARSLRGRLNNELAANASGMFIKETIAEATQLNDDLMRCHDTLAERAEEAFRFVRTGRARRGTVSDVWGLVDPRGCFDELAPAWDVLLD